MSAFNPNEHLTNLKGRDYLEVKWRLVWFREEKQSWGIRTSLVAHDAQGKAAIFKAEIVDDKGFVVSTGYGSETVADFRDYLEKAETKAVGRALAMAGYGTQFAPEFDEGERIVDAPVAPKASQKTPPAPPKQTKGWHPTDAMVKAMKSAVEGLKAVLPADIAESHLAHFREKYKEVFESGNKDTFDAFLEEVASDVVFCKNMAAQKQGGEENAALIAAEQSNEQELNEAADAVW